MSSGYLQTRCCFFLMNIHTKPRVIYFARVSMLPGDVRLHRLTISLANL